MRPLLASRTLPLLLIPALIALGAAALPEPLSVSQMNRTFQPARVELVAGGALRIVNDDGELLHHAYVSSPTLNFDSGEQDPGSAVLIRFPDAGHWTVLCAIHPRMKLDVTVH